MKIRRLSKWVWKIFPLLLFMTVGCEGFLQWEQPEQSPTETSSTSIAEQDDSDATIGAPDDAMPADETDVAEATQDAGTISGGGLAGGLGAPVASNTNPNTAATGAQNSSLTGTAGPGNDNPIECPAAQCRQWQWGHPAEIANLPMLAGYEPMVMNAGFIGEGNEKQVFIVINGQRAGLDPALMPKSSKVITLNSLLGTDALERDLNWTATVMPSGGDSYIGQYGYLATNQGGNGDLVWWEGEVRPNLTLTDLKLKSAMLTVNNGLDWKITDVVSGSDYFLGTSAIAMDAIGNVTLAYNRTEAKPASFADIGMWGSAYDADMAVWVPEMSLSAQLPGVASPGNAWSIASIAPSSDSDESMIVWGQIVQNQVRIAAIRFDFNATVSQWQNPVFISEASITDNANDPAVVYNAVSKEYIAIWNQVDSNDANDREIYWARFDDSGSWQPADRLVSDFDRYGKYVGIPVIDSCASGKTIVAWRENDISNGLDYIRVVTYEPDKGWGPISELATAHESEDFLADPHLVCRPQYAVASDGIEAVLIWGRSNADRNALMLEGGILASGQGWVRSAPITDSFMHNLRIYGIASDPETGEVLAYWSQGENALFPYGPFHYFVNLFSTRPNL